MKLKAITAGLLAAAMLTACGANDQPTAQGGSVKPGGTLYLLTDSPSVTWDPAKSSNLVITTLSFVHRRLTSWNVAPGKDTTIVPDLATDTGRPSDGGKTWTFTLKDGLFFETGAPITSADVKWGVSRAWDPEIGIGSPYAKQLIDAPASYQGPYKSGDLPTITTPDAKTIVFKLKKPFADFGSVVAQNT